MPAGFVAFNNALHNAAKAVRRAALEGESP